MAKTKGKGKRPLATHGEDSAHRRSTRANGVESTGGIEVLRTCSVTGPPVLPPVPPRSGGSLRLTELSLKSTRIYQDTILSVRDLLSARECKAWIDFGDEKGFERTFHTQTSEIAHRDNGRITIHSPHVAAAIFARVGPFVPREMGGRAAIGCNSNIRIYRYAVGQRFGKHVDESVEDENGHLSQWTVLIYLNGGSQEGATINKLESKKGAASTGEEPLRGGETVFYKGNYGGKIAASFSPLQGACLVHGHGRRCLLHEGAPVTTGVKYLLRTDVMYA